MFPSILKKEKSHPSLGRMVRGKVRYSSAVSRLIKHDVGEIMIDKKEINSWKSNELSKKVAILKQANNLNVRLTIRELVSFGRFPYSQGNLTQEDWDKVDEALSFMELHEIENNFWMSSVVVNANVHSSPWSSLRTPNIFCSMNH